MFIKSKLPLIKHRVVIEMVQPGKGSVAATLLNKLIFANREVLISNSKQVSKVSETWIKRCVPKSSLTMQKQQKREENMILEGVDS